MRTYVEQPLLTNKTRWEAVVPNEIFAAIQVVNYEQRQYQPQRTIASVAFFIGFKSLIVKGTCINDPGRYNFNEPTPNAISLLDQVKIDTSEL